MKKYIELIENEKATHLCVELYYDLGGVSWATYQQKERGYYLRVVPVKKETRHGVQMESFVAFTGYSQLIKPVTRKSAKAETAAETAAAEILDIMIARVCHKNGLEVKQ